MYPLPPAERTPGTFREGALAEPVELSPAGWRRHRKSPPQTMVTVCNLQAPATVAEIRAHFK